jgi:hypothetical protein
VNIAESLVQVVWYARERLREALSEPDHHLFTLVEPDVVGVRAGVDQRPAEVRRTDQAVCSGGDRVREQVREAFAEERHHGLAKVVPSHERVKRSWRMQQSCLHVGDAAETPERDVVRLAQIGRC